jgi:hypothetical protein
MVFKNIKITSWNLCRLLHLRILDYKIKKLWKFLKNKDSNLNNPTVLNKTISYGCLKNDSLFSDYHNYGFSAIVLAIWFEIFCYFVHHYGWPFWATQKLNSMSIFRKPKLNDAATLFTILNCDDLCNFSPAKFLLTNDHLSKNGSKCSKSSFALKC